MFFISLVIRLNNVAQQPCFNNRRLAPRDVLFCTQADFRLHEQLRRIERTGQHRAQQFADQLRLGCFILAVRIDGFAQKRPHRKRFLVVERRANDVQPLLMLLIMLDKCAE